MHNSEVQGLRLQSEPICSVDINPPINPSAPNPHWFVCGFGRKIMVHSCAHVSKDLLYKNVFNSGGEKAGNPKPKTPSPKPSTPIPQPRTPNPNPQTLNRLAVLQIRVGYGRPAWYRDLERHPNSRLILGQFRF